MGPGSYTHLDVYKRQLYDYYHLGDEGSFDFDIKKAKKVGADCRNDLCNGMVKYFPEMCIRDRVYSKEDWQIPHFKGDGFHPYL